MLLEKKVRIIAGFAGVGKSTFCEKNENAFDLVCMPFKYENFMEIASKYGEKSIRANEELKIKEGWTSLYYDTLLEIYNSYPDEIIVIPTIGIILEWLEGDEIPYKLVYPSRKSKEEYKKRFLQRGDSKEFLDIFVGAWDYWLRNIRLHVTADCIELQPEQYLADVIQLSEYDEDKIIKNKKSYISKKLWLEGKKAFYELRALAAGVQEMTLDDINKEIFETRDERKKRIFLNKKR